VVVHAPAPPPGRGHCYAAGAAGASRDRARSRIPRSTRLAGDRLRVMDWLKTHKTMTAVLALVVVWIVYRTISGKGITSSGHASPEDAISYGWAVFPAGSTGWLEVSPDGNKRYMHDTGWTGDPYAKV
jgi:hypothetical protein